MFSATRTLFCTFVIALTLLIALAPQGVDASINNANAIPVHRRQANRMIRKRQSIGIIGVGEDPASATSTGTVDADGETSAAPGTTTTPAATGSSTPPATTTETTTAVSTTSTSTSTSSTSTSTSTSATSTSSSSSSTLSSTMSSSSTSSTSSETLAVTAAPDISLTSSSSQQGSTVTLSTTAAQESATESASAVGASSKSISKTTITIIAVVGGSIAGAIIIWTIIRKWKFRPSAEFEDRLEPIDWSPEATHSQPGLGLHRTASNASHGSFHSGSENHDAFAGPRPGAYGTRGAGGLVADIPPHDFTAGPAHLGGGYADLTRGPSPGPQMSQAVARGPSFNRGYGY